ncbi:cache domain-containing sensor histidine kinase [Paenibacillus sp. Leaf72]|uniref:cache domain-containing sensor histidine kinase n=1 Tax=Paenibacillus sp. Leaf72 TaxID=1736234 RepID=UPI0006FAC266|nr:sensor histidine kinase [Paenibacillus sp. Leaf72]KQO00634.1 hypothetical protein ASF12_17910 [Paenibacillus sp. Leaf72]
MRKIRERVRDMKFRTRLILFFVLLITLPSVLNGILHYSASSDIIVTNARDSMLEIVKKNNEIGDIVFSNIEERTVSLISDPDLYRLFNRPKPQNDYELVQMDRQATVILNKYFGHDQDLYTAQLVTSYFSFGSGSGMYTSSSPFVSADPQGFRKSAIYKEVMASRGSLIWVPTYDLTRAFQQEALYDMDAKFRMVFSCARLLNSSPIIDGAIYNWPEHVERPVLLLNFNESFYQRSVQQSLSAVQGSYFYIVSKDGKIVTHPELSKLGTADHNQWYKTEFRQPFGTSLVKENGEDVLISYDTSQVTGWVTVNVTPYKQLLGNLPAIRYMDILSGVALLIISIVIASFIAGRLTQPIKKMLVAIQMTGAGDFTAKIPDQPQLEFRILTKKFNVMNDKIRELIQENYESRLREKETEIMALNLQLNPHFLYNTLNIINWMAIDRDEPAISRMIVSLSSMLQYTVKNKQEMVRLRDDLNWLQSYTHIMENRFDGIFKVAYDLEGVPEDSLVPKLFLQPLVENAMIHGFESGEPGEQGGLVNISGRMVEDRLLFEVSDNGKGMSPQQAADARSKEGAGIGMSNVISRLALLYGEQAELRVRSKPGEGTTITVVIPLQR